MREFTPEEKEMIINTPIRIECFDMSDYSNVEVRLSAIGVDFYTSQSMWLTLINWLESLRKAYKKEGHEFYFNELIRLLPNSYKVVKLSNDNSNMVVKHGNV